MKVVCTESSMRSRSKQATLSAWGSLILKRVPGMAGRQKGGVPGKDGSWAKAQKWRRAWCRACAWWIPSSPSGTVLLESASATTLSAETATTATHLPFHTPVSFKNRRLKLFTWLNFLNSRTLSLYLAWLFGCSVNENGVFQSWVTWDHFRESPWPWAGSWGRSHMSSRPLFQEKSRKDDNNIFWSTADSSSCSALKGWITKQQRINQMI